MNPLTEPQSKASVNLHDYRRAFLYKDLRSLRFTSFVFAMLQKPWLVKALTGLSGWAIRTGMPVTALMRNTIFPVFCAGETISQALATIDRLERYNVGAVLDYVSEAECTPEAFKRNSRIIADNIRTLAEKNPGSSVSVKLTGLESPDFLSRINLADTDSLNVADRRRYDDFIDRVDTICFAGARHGITVYIDAEDRCMQDLFDRTVEMMMARYNRGTAIVYNTVQMYLRDRLEYLQRVIAESSLAGYYPGLKLVRGAYVEKERERAASKGIQCPVHDSKTATDKSFDAGLGLCLSNSDRVFTCVASHNERSTLLAVQLIDVHGIGDHYRKVKFSQLYGMSDNITFNLAARGYNASKYLPYGEVKKAIPYLIRRAEENSSISGQLPKELICLRSEIARRKRQQNSVISDRS